MNIHLFGVSIIIVLFVLGACRSSKKMATDVHSGKSAAQPEEVRYRLIYIIHGDANYLYHNEKGKGLQSDEQQLKKAIAVAEKANHGEVFIFHQKPEKSILWLFPRKDRLLLHYRNGKQIRSKNYSPVSTEKAFVSESRLYHQYRSENTARTFFLYFGHEIPHDEDVAYFRSRPDAKLTTRTFTEGERSFLEEGSHFELAVLSTCDNGTPEMVSRQKSLTNYLLASPQNLHLSQIDSRKLLLLEENPKISARKLSQAIAEDSFKRLSNFLQTAVTLSVYEMDKVKPYIDSLSATYDQAMREKSGQAFEQDNIDCWVLPFWNRKQRLPGITTFYKPARFGKYADKVEHSGWGCQE